MSKLLSKLQRWRTQVRTLLGVPALGSKESVSNLHRFVHFWVLLWQSFTRNRCPIRASALAYATLLSLIPLLAIVVSITSTFLKSEGEDRIDEFIGKLVTSVTTGAAPAHTNAWAPGTATNLTLAPAPESTESRGPETNAVASTNSVSSQASSLAQDPRVLATRKEIAGYIHSFIQNTRSGALGVTGSIVLIFAAISLLSRIEDTFNDIWGVDRGRSWFMRIVLYWGVLSLAPLLLVVAIGMATGSHVESSKRMIEHMPLIGGLLVRFGFSLLPILILCLGFAAFYMLIPNTRVHWRAALVGGFSGGLLFHLNNVISVLYVSRVVSNSKIYGSLGLVLVFMIGLYFSWLILLFGAQVAYAWQNRATYLEEKQAENVDQRGREFIALRLMTAISERFARAQPPLNLSELSNSLSVPSRLLRRILGTLIAANLVVETSGTEPAFLPARPLETMTCHDILSAMRSRPGQDLATRDEPLRAELYGEFQRIEQAERQAAASITMLALAQRTGKQLTE